MESWIVLVYFIYILPRFGQVTNLTVVNNNDSVVAWQLFHPLEAKYKGNISLAQPASLFPFGKACRFDDRENILPANAFCKAQQSEQPWKAI
jgi:hypothetical protein